jgi:hypothetical protein
MVEAPEVMPETSVAEPRPSSDGASMAASETSQIREPTLTPDEIEVRTQRYENWLRQKGLRRVGDVTTDANNPY